MTDIEKKALALLNEVRAEYGYKDMRELGPSADHTLTEALCRAIEQHEAFRQEVSDAASAAVTLIETWVGDERAGKISADPLRRFIIPEPVDPLAECLLELDLSENDEQARHDAAWLENAIAKRGGKIVWENSDA